jgi:hypothetical protein
MEAYNRTGFGHEVGKNEKEIQYCKTCLIGEAEAIFISGWEIQVTPDRVIGGGVQNH